MVKLKWMVFTFEGYTSIIDSGDGDFLTEDTLWDFKVFKTTTTEKQYASISDILFNG